MLNDKMIKRIIINCFFKIFLIYFNFSVEQLKNYRSLLFKKKNILKNNF